MSNDDSSDHIAGHLTAKDWQTRNIELSADENATHWDKAFDDFLMNRLLDRYLTSIKVLQDNGKHHGEGFTIVSVQCALIEFLAALKEGKRYKSQRKGEEIGQHEYISSNALFCGFLVREEPFREYFPEISDARGFYQNVRCALLHEARTENGWRIWASGPIAVDAKEKIVRRDALQIAINTYLESYRLLLMQDKSVQEAFIRKFDDLAAI